LADVVDLAGGRHEFFRIGPPPCPHMVFHGRKSRRCSSFDKEEMPPPALAGLLSRSVF
jgi:hypothetical protein